MTRKKISHEQSVKCQFCPKSFSALRWNTGKTHFFVYISSTNWSVCNLKKGEQYQNTLCLCSLFYLDKIGYHTFFVIKISLYSKVFCVFWNLVVAVHMLLHRLKIWMKKYKNYSRFAHFLILASLTHNFSTLGNLFNTF